MNTYRNNINDYKAIKMKTKSIKELREEFDKLSEEELNKLAKKEDVYLTSSDEIFENNSYDVPRIIAIYWRPALNGAEAKVLDYLVYKTWGFDHRFLDAGIDAIAFDQIINGTKGKYEKKEIRYDYGAGVTKSAAAESLIILEFLGIIEVMREQNEKGAYLTNKYRIKTAHEWERMSVSQKKIFMLEDPFVKVERARKYLKKIGRLRRKIT